MQVRAENIDGRINVQSLKPLNGDVSAIEEPVDAQPPGAIVVVQPQVEWQVHIVDCADFIIITFRSLLVPLLVQQAQGITQGANTEPDTIVRLHDVDLKLMVALPRRQYLVAVHSIAGSRAHSLVLEDWCLCARKSGAEHVRGEKAGAGYVHIVLNHHGCPLSLIAANSRSSHLTAHPRLGTRRVPLCS